MRLIGKLSATELDHIHQALLILYELRDSKVILFNADEAIECLEGVYKDGK